MAEWPEGLLINKSIHRNIDSVLVFRFRSHYVNLLLLIIFAIMLQNLQLEGTAQDDVINYISTVFEIRRFH